MWAISMLSSSPHSESALTTFVQKRLIDPIQSQITNHQLLRVINGEKTLHLKIKTYIEILFVGKKAKLTGI
jgi:hypothetical protein